MTRCKKDACFTLPGVGEKKEGRSINEQILPIFSIGSSRSVSVVFARLVCVDKLLILIVSFCQSRYKIFLNRYDSIMKSCAFHSEKQNGYGGGNDFRGNNGEPNTVNSQNKRKDKHGCQLKKERAQK